MHSGKYSKIAYAIIQTPGVRLVFLTVAALLCFALNSLLCRVALVSNAIDPATFTTVRVAAAVAALTAIMASTKRVTFRISVKEWRPAFALIVYLFLFSFAYTRISAGAGALLMFGAVQLSMVLVALWNGEKLTSLSWAAFLIAAAGLVYLVLPGISAPDLTGSVLMLGSGLAWGFFSLLARNFPNPVEENANNFLFCLPVVAAANIAFATEFKLTMVGFLCAAISGAVVSGAGYSIWYLALRYLSRIQAAAVQLTVPVLTALGGSAFLSEPLTHRLFLSSAAILGGISIMLAQKSTSGSADISAAE